MNPVYLWRSVPQYGVPKTPRNRVATLPKKSKNHEKCQVFQCFSWILTHLNNHSWTLSDTLWHNIYTLELRQFIPITHEPSKSTKCKKYGNHRASATCPRMEHIFKTLTPVILRLQNFPGPLEYTIRTGTYQTPTWEGFRTDLTTGGRAISIFVKIFLEKAHSIFGTICLPIVL